MAIPFALLRESIILILYDYMLTSDHDGFWFSIPAIHEALPGGTSGAFTQRALDGLIGEILVEQGGSEPHMKDLFALTEHGIKAAEDILKKRGFSIEDYEPSPDSDQILSKLHQPEEHAAINHGLNELRIEIGRSNSFDREADGNGDLLEGEISAASTLMAASRIRVSRLKTLLLPALKYLAQKFADQSIGQLATKLVALLVGLDT